MSSLKTRLRDALPGQLQVPARYWYDRALGRLEPEMRLLPLLVKQRDRVIDVGGNRGVYTYHLCRLGAAVEVFEPNENCQSVLSSWAAHNSGVTLHPVALSSQPGSACLHIPVDDAGVEHDSSASLDGARGGRARDQAVLLRTLDSYGFNQVSLIKIDVEGHESSVIAGAGATLAASRPALLVEIERRHIAKPVQAVFEQIRQLDYHGFFLCNHRLTTLDDFDESRHQHPSHFATPGTVYINNFLFLHRDRLAGGEYQGLFRDGVPG
ncbi:MAG: FkbM family methyltransferase [Halioglobus sp.]